MYGVLHMKLSEQLQCEYQQYLDAGFDFKYMIAEIQALEEKARLYDEIDAEYLAACKEDGIEVDDNKS